MGVLGTADNGRLWLAPTSFSPPPIFSKMGRVLVVQYSKKLHYNTDLGASLHDH